MASEIPTKRKYVYVGLMVTMLVISIVGSFFLIQHWEYISRLEQQGYLGLFIISIFAGSPIPIPTPSMILTFTLGSLLSPLLVGLVSGLGNGIGNALVFWTGRGGHMVFRSFITPTSSDDPPRSRIGRFFKRTSRMPDLTKRRGFLAIFLLSIYPNPVLVPLTLGMGATRSSFINFFLACWAGKTAQSLILAYLGYFGLRSLLHFFGIFNIP
jgi:membrane protein YqaA with SNARE-associated domain